MKWTRIKVCLECHDRQVTEASEPETTDEVNQLAWEEAKSPHGMVTTTFCKSKWCKNTMQKHNIRVVPDGCLAVSQDEFL